MSAQNRNLGTFFQSKCLEYDTQDLFGEKKAGTWVWQTWNEANQKIRRLGAFLDEHGIQHGEKVAILGNNSAQWVMADLAIMSIGGVSVPVYTTAHCQYMRHVLTHSEASALIVDHALLTPELSSIVENLETIRFVIVMNHPQTAHQIEKTCIQMDDIVNTEKEADTETFYKRLQKVKPEDLSSIIYTSGTTGTPKGVMLTHHNIISNIDMCQDIVYADHHDISLSFLPLSHVFERTGGIYFFMSKGIRIAFAESIETVVQNILEIRPTLFCTVPRLLEKIHSSVMVKINGLPMGLGSYVRKLLNDDPEKTSWFGKLQFGLVDRLIFRKVRRKLGGRLRYIVSGGAPLSPQVGHELARLGLVILQGYGLTETSPIISVNRPESNRSDSVGPPLKELQLKILSDGEILVKGASISPGYYQNEAETRLQFDEDGFFHTGDIGELRDGYLYITDRKKEIIVTSGGKNVAPSPIENEIKNSPLVENACLIGDSRKYLSVLIIPEFEQLKALPLLKGGAEMANSELLSKPEVQSLYENVIQQINASRASYEQIKKFKLLSKPFTIENDEITPTLKLKRRNIAARYQSEIDDMY